MADVSPFDGATLSLDPDDCEPRQVYKLMTASLFPGLLLLYPRSIATASRIWRAFSFFSGVGSNPPP